MALQHDVNYSNNHQHMNLHCGKHDYIYCFQNTTDIIHLKDVFTTIQFNVLHKTARSIIIDTLYAQQAI